MNNFQCFLAIFVTLATPKLSSSLKCYVCSMPQEKCGDPFNATAHTGEICDLDAPFCIKQKLPLVGKNSAGTHRACGAEDYCKLYEETTKNCYTCKSDLCNSSSLPLPSIGTWVQLLFVTFKHIF